MNITIQGQNYKVSEAIETFAQEKLERLGRYLPHISDIRMDISKQNTRRGGDLTIAQITLRHERGAILRSEEKIDGNGHESVKAAINAAVDKMYRRINRFKGKRQNRKGKERFSASLEEIEMSEVAPETSDYDEEEAVTIDAEIVRRKEIPVGLMTEVEAVEQMELLGHTFFMFMDAATGKISVVYRRAGGDYGMLVPL